MTRRKQTKKALTSSVLALVLCFVMLLGTTFAWFTDTASTKVSKIQAGTLDIDIVDKEGNSVSGKTLSFVDSDGKEKSEILWEPNCTYKLPTLQVANEGNLALKYKVIFTLVDGDEALADVLDVQMLDNNEWKTVGTLSEALNPTNKDGSEDSDGFAHGTLAANAKSAELNIALHMQETAGNAYQGLKIDGVRVDVVATQAVSESDSFGNTYDKKADFSFSDSTGNLSTLKTALSENSAVYDGKGAMVVFKDTDASNVNSQTTAQFFLPLDGEKTIKNVTFVFDDTDAIITGSGPNNKHDVKLASLQITKAKNAESAGVTFSGCTFIGMSVETYLIDSASFENCKWENVPYGRYALHWNLVKNLTVEGCTFDNCAGGIYVRLQNDSGLNVNITNNKFVGTNGHAILFGGTPAEDAKITISNNEASGWSLVGWTTQNNSADGSIDKTTVESYVGDGNTYGTKSFTENWTGLGYTNS